MTLQIAVILAVSLSIIIVGFRRVAFLMTERQGYPIIFGADHAEFEAEWAASGRPAHERPDWPYPSFDARDWADAFCKRYPAMPNDVMVSWFANALMRGYDEPRY